MLMSAAIYKAGNVYTYFTCIYIGRHKQKRKSPKKIKIEVKTKINDEIYLV